MTATPNSCPLTRSKDLLAERVGAELVVYDTKSKHAHNLGPLAATVYARCDGKTPVPELAALASTELDEPISVERINDVLADLEALSLLVTPVPGTVSRRQVMRKGALAGAAVLATQYVTSVTTPAIAASCPNANCQGDVSKCAGKDCAPASGTCRCVCTGGTILTTNSQTCPGGQSAQCRCLG